MRRFWDFLVYGIIIGGILVLTRPGSQGPGLVSALGGAVSGFGQAVTGQKVTTLKAR